MKYDINKLLDLEYLNEFITKYNAQFSQLNASYVQLWTFDKVKEMSIDAVVEFFAKYGVDCSNIVQYIESDFIDEQWEFADLFLDDINYSRELKETLKNNALKEIEILNGKIQINNDSVNKNVSLLEEDMKNINIFLKVLDENEVVLAKDITNIYNFIMGLDCSDEEKFNFSNNLARLLITKNKKILSSKHAIETAAFEEELDEVYGNSDINQVEDEQIDENIRGYSETIKGYYDFYKELMREAGLGNTLEEVMDLASGMAVGVESTLHSIDKEDFCIELGSILSKLHQTQSKEKVDQEVISDALIDLAVLDRIYEENEKNSAKHQELLQKVTEDLELIALIPKEYINNDYVNKIINILRVLKLELSKKLMDNEGLEEIGEKYSDAGKKVGKVQSIIKMIETLNKVNEGLISIMHSPNFVNSEESQNMGIYEFQDRVLSLLEEIKNKGYKKEFEGQLNAIIREFNQYIMVEPEKVEKISLKGFVLFDFDNQFVPYVISDLDPNSKHNLLDNSISQKKMVSGFEDYNKLIHDLLIYGKPEILNDHSQIYYLSRLMDSVYYDEAKNRSTGMVRIRPLRNSLVRFISKEVILTPGTEMHQQVITLITEKLPNVVIDSEKEFSLFINFASSLKIADTDSYDMAINRLDKNSPLYKLFFRQAYKTKLTEDEYVLLRDILSMTLDAYKELEKNNENLKFDIINQIGGKKSRG